MELELGQRDLDRLLQLERKFAKEGLTFDDVLLVPALMTSSNLVTAPVGTTLPEAEAILHRNKVEKLPVVDGGGILRGLITVKDIQKKIQFPNATKDERGRLRVAAAVGVGPDAWERAGALVDAGADAIVVDTAHGHSAAVTEMVRRLKREWAVDVIAGNVATAAATEALIDAGADAVKVGVGPGGICTTRVVAGVGMPQVTAIYDCAQVAARHDVCLIGDGGLTSSGDIAKAIAAGAELPQGLRSCAWRTGGPKSVRSS